MRHSSCLSKTSSHMIELNWRGMTVVWHLLQKYFPDAFKGQNPSQRDRKTAFFMRSNMHIPSGLVLTPHVPVHVAADSFMDMVKHSEYPPDSSIL